MAVDAVVVRDRVVDRLDPIEIGGVERVLTARPADRLLAEQARQRADHRIERGDRVEPHGVTSRLEPSTHRRVDQGVDDEAGLGGDLVQHAIEMAFGSHHRPEMLDRLDALELGEAGLGDILQRLAGGIREIGRAHV